MCHLLLEPLCFLARGLCADLLRLVLSRKGRVPLKQIDAIEVLLRDQPIAPRHDEWVLASAVLAEADLFVSGDQGVLACAAPPLPWVNPRGCWEQLRSTARAAIQASPANQQWWPTDRSQGNSWRRMHTRSTDPLKQPGAAPAHLPALAHPCVYAGSNPGPGGGCRRLARSR